MLSPRRSRAAACRQEYAMAMLASLPTSFHPQWNWPRVSALAGTLSLHAIVILVLLIPATALQMLHPAAVPPVFARWIEPPPKIPEVELPVPQALVHPQPHPKPRPAPQRPMSAQIPVDNPTSDIQVQVTAERCRRRRPTARPRPWRITHARPCRIHTMRCDCMSKVPSCCACWSALMDCRRRSR